MLTIRIDPVDTVAVAVKILAKGTRIDGNIVTRAAILFGHKVALVPIKKGAPVIKYGESIGKATKNIRPGDWVHSHNLGSGLTSRKTYRYQPGARTTVPAPAANPTQFQGYVRANGRVGTRNEIWIIPTVHCVNKFTEQVARIANRRFKSTPNFDGVWAFPHAYGCSQAGTDHENTRAILRNLALHPNAGGVLIVSLGCENNTLESFMGSLGTFDPARIKSIKLQDITDDYNEALALLTSIHRTVTKSKRTLVGVDKLVVGVKCGGSDAFSGITANPLIGTMSDILTSHGGTVLMGEVPEMFGAEHLLMKRAANKNVFRKTVALINSFKDFFSNYDCPIYENPSPGNRQGGITTLEEKSLGCTQKSGKSIVYDVLDCCDTWHAPGLNLMKTPGNDGVSSTALTAAGATAILFSTGRGTPIGAPVPTIKISTNTELFNRKKAWIDLNTGGMLLNVKGRTSIAHGLWLKIIKTASGAYHTANERYGFKEIFILKNGVTL
jgi:altronate hydrolase